MDFQSVQAPAPQWETDILIFFCTDDSDPLLPGFRRWMDEHAPWLKQTKALEDIRGKHKATTVLYAPEPGPAPRILVTGLGKREECTLEKLRQSAAAAARCCRELRVDRAGLPAQALEGLAFSLEAGLREAVLAFTLGLYKNDRLKTRNGEEKTPDLPARLTLFHQEPLPELAGMLEETAAVIQGITTARDLTTEPSNLVTPIRMAQRAAEIAQAYGMHFEAFDLDKARELGMGAFAAVAQGSREPARFIVVEHAPAGTEAQSPIVMVGKGITFDTGGISIKPSAKMEDMKRDMAGAASVLGAMECIGRLGLRRRVVALLPCTENMPDGKAYKPGDVIKTHAGLTVEVISTDAEGRMILCDALSYAQKYQPACIVDLATLTGACVVALGDRVAGLMGNRDDFLQKIKDAGDPVGELFWPLPLYDFYFEEMKSDVADFKNVGNRQAGAIIGGMFLKQFVDDKTPWAHMDIAGTAMAEKDLGWIPKGASGFGVRTLVELVKGWDAWQMG
ncbi:leucyl aminopeptidase [Desulfacinum hydrothermale DSM 13146]|uniref:Probable cytosol aminopeptidase n=1 Tax=Desulfacinum hydrothermale DSM 13146 TaxID=1121390 RepID=A0A1W1XFP5_9BACT|nr:leucyl aminopeptidase [Desulfacinum hydrothermale]SMC22815.1 leucyl aminopeptidase [Desulfacinum hydrothermale DSM 13146]